MLPEPERQVGLPYDRWRHHLSPPPQFRHGASCSSPVVKVSDHGRHVMSSSPVPLKTHRVGQRYTLNLSRAETPPVGVVW
ncbi:uncharacterized protein TNCV_4910501 [Trichonephila clavipes]|nr:uncharacterized protein TNCV_4910501 [Trichonephila clavipes]